jgi:hypothetical protein
MNTAIQAADYPLAVNTVSDLQNLGALMAASGYFSDARSAAQASVKILAGRELGFGPFASMKGVHVIEGTPTVGAHLMASAIKRSGRYDYQVHRCDKEACDIEFFAWRKGARESLGHVGMTLADAVAQELTVNKEGKPKKNWRTVPDDMLFARVISKGFRRHCPDLTGGVPVYVADELDAGDEEDRPQAPPAEQPAPQALTAPPASPPFNSGPRVDRITEEQSVELVGLIRETGTDVTKLLAHYRIKAIQQLPAEKWGEVRDRLLSRKAPPNGTPAVETLSMDQRLTIIDLAGRQGLDPVKLARDYFASDGVAAIPAHWFTWLRLMLEDKADLQAVCERERVRRLSDLSVARSGQLTRGYLQGRIDNLITGLKITPDQFRTRIQALYDTAEASALTVPQLEQLERRLADYQAKLASAPAARAPVEP